MATLTQTEQTLLALIRKMTSEKKVKVKPPSERERIDHYKSLII